MKSSEEIFEETLGQLGTNLTVALVATPDPWSCEETADIDDVLDYMHQMDFSQAPVERDRSVIGVLDRDHIDIQKPLHENIQPLSERILVSSRSSLRSVIRALAHDENRYRLVVGTEGVEGIVTRADVQKLPVRLLAFTLITHLEALMAETIASRCDHDEWTTYLKRSSVWLPEDIHQKLKNSTGKSGWDKLRKRHERNQKRDAAPSLLQETDFSQKWYVVVQMLGLEGGAIRDFARLQEGLRNVIMHTKDYAADDFQLDDFNELLEITESWIDRFAERLATGKVQADEVAPVVVPN